MKDYRSIFEIQRRKNDFNKSYSSCYDKAGLGRFMSKGLNNERALQVVDEPDKASIINELLPWCLPLMRVMALGSYVFKYCSMDEVILTNPQHDEIESLSQYSLDGATMTSGEIYDFLKTIHPSYAEALLSFIDNLDIDVFERLLDVFNSNDKQSFISILPKDHDNTYRLLHLCKLYKDNDISEYLSQITGLIDFIKENETSIREIPLDNIKDGNKIRTILSIKSKIEGREGELNVLSKEFDLQLYQVYKHVVRIYLMAEGILSEDQRNQYQGLLHEENIVKWYEKAYNECVAEFQIETPTIFSNANTEEIEEKPERLKLPQDFFIRQTYRIQNIPCFSLSPRPTSEQMIDIGYLLVEHGCIENTPTAIYKFICAFTGRSLNPKEEDFEKAEWLGKFKDLVFMVKFFTPDTGKKYSKILDLFTIVDPNEKQQFEEILKSGKSPSPYANNCSKLEKKLKSILSSKK